MKHPSITLFLALVAVAAIVWACNYPFSGLGWFPGFVIAVFCGIKIMEVEEIGQEKQKKTRP